MKRSLLLAALVLTTSSCGGTPKDVLYPVATTTLDALDTEVALRYHDRHNYCLDNVRNLGEYNTCMAKVERLVSYLSAFHAFLTDVARGDSDICQVPRYVDILRPHLPEFRFDDLLSAAEGVCDGR